jgi:hypothetical protein
MPRKITVVLVEEFTHHGDRYARYRDPATGRCTDVRVQHRNTAVIWTAAQARAEAQRRLNGPWHHPHLVR